MITLDGNCVVDASIDGSELLSSLTPASFRSLKILERSGVILPVFELTLLQAGFQLVKDLRKVNSKIKLSYGVSKDTLRTYTYNILNYNSVSSNGQQLFTLTGVLDVPEFTNVPRIQFIEGTSDQVFNKISSLKPEVNYSGGDNQIWIQHNNSDKNFVERVLAHSFVSDNNCILGAITSDSQLIITSLKDAFSSNEAKYNIGISGQNAIKPIGISVESDSALWSSFLSEGRSLSILNVEDRSIDHFSSSPVSVVDNSSNSGVLENVAYPLQLNNGNCHDNYYQAYINNLNYSTQLLRNCVYVTTSSYLPNDELKLHDLLNYMTSDKSLNSTVDAMSGTYILMEKVMSFSDRSFTQRLKLCRDFLLE